MEATRNAKARATDNGRHGGEGVSTRSGAVAKEGLNTTDDIGRMMMAVIEDVVSGNMSDGTGNVVVNAAGKLMKSVELRMKYGSTVQPTESRKLYLTT